MATIPSIAELDAERAIHRQEMFRDVLLKHPTLIIMVGFSLPEVLDLTALVKLAVAVIRDAEAVARIIDGELPTADVLVLYWPGLDPAMRKKAGPLLVYPRTLHKRVVVCCDHIQDVGHGHLPNASHILYAPRYCREIVRHGDFLCRPMAERPTGDHHQESSRYETW
jgi:hypothetical protein